MAHIELSHAEMKPAPIVRYEIAQDFQRTKTLLFGSVIGAVIILVMASMFLTAFH